MNERSSIDHAGHTSVSRVYGTSALLFALFCACGPRDRLAPMGGAAASAGNAAGGAAAQGGAAGGAAASAGGAAASAGAAARGGETTASGGKSNHATGGASASSDFTPCVATLVRGRLPASSVSEAAVALATAQARCHPTPDELEALAAALTRGLD